MNWVTRKLRLWWLKCRASMALMFKWPTEAMRAYREMLDIDSRNELAHLMIGNLLADAGDKAGAIAQLEQLIAVNPANADAWFNVGFLHDQDDRLDDAERCFRKAVHLRPSLDRAWYGLGLVLIRDGRLEEAVTALQATIKLQPFSPYGYFQLGLTYHHLGRSKDAWRVHKQLEGFEPKFSATLKRDLESAMPQAVSASNPNRQPKEETIVDA